MVVLRPRRVGRCDAGLIWRGGCLAPCEWRDLSPFIKGRYPFRAGKKKAEVYGLFQVGFTMAFLRESTGAADRFGPGWNIGLTPGFQVLLARRFGIVTELGWLRTQGNFDGGNLVLNQGVWRVGFVF